MELKRQVTLVSVYGRGHWLAAALAKEGMSVTLIDLTSKMGAWTSEDAEGPFGFLKSDRFDELQNEAIMSNDPFEEVANGFSIWLQNGPVEFKSSVTPFYFEKNKWDHRYAEVLSSGALSLNSKFKSFYNDLDFNKFAQEWIVHFAHQWSATTYLPNVQSAFSGYANSILSSFYTRHATRMGLEKSLQWLRTKNVEVLTDTEIKDCSFGSAKVITGLELFGEKHGHSRVDQLIWLLSSEESYFLSEKLAKYFYPSGMVEPEWCWSRLRVKLDACPERDCLPTHTVIVNDQYSPWSHENLMILQRTMVPDQFDVWMRIPNVQRFNKEYLALRGNSIVQVLRSKMQVSNPQVSAYSQEYYYTYSQLGASRYPVFAEKESAKRHKNHFQNVFLDSPEIWTQYSWEEYMRTQGQILSQITNWWKLEVVKFQKSQQRKEQHP